MTQATLYSFRRCPYAIRARLAISAANITVTLREIELKNKPQVMLDHSPKGTVPVLVINNTAVIDESLQIIFWALETNDPNTLLSGLNKEQLSATQKLINTNDNDFKYWLDRYKYADRFPEQTEAFYFEQAQTFLVELENKLQQQNFLFTEQPTLADIAIFPFIRQFAFVDKAKFDRLSYPKLKQWLNYWLSSELFSSVMNKYQPWLDSKIEYLFPEH
ncbi:MAG: glutathione S-transferase [Parashewanella sp.]